MTVADKTRLERRLKDTEPKCATCAFWDVPRLPPHDEPDDPVITAATCNRNKMRTTNLMVCTGWHDAVTDQEVLEP